MMRFTMFFLTMFFTISCATSDQSTSVTNQEQVTTSSNQKKYANWQENSEEDKRMAHEIELGVNFVMDAFGEAQKLSVMLSKPMYVILEGGGANKITVYTLVSEPGEVPVKLGKQHKVIELPKNVTFAEDKREFWCDSARKIWFNEPDRMLLVRQETITADVIIWPKDPASNPRRGLVDFLKGSSQITLHGEIDR